MADRIRIDQSALTSLSAPNGRIVNGTSDAVELARKAKNALDWEVSGREEIDSTLNSLITRLNRQEIKARNMAGLLEMAGSKERAENDDLVSRTGNIKGFGSAVKASASWNSLSDTNSSASDKNAADITLNGISAFKKSVLGSAFGLTGAAAWNEGYVSDVLKNAWSGKNVSGDTAAAEVGMTASFLSGVYGAVPEIVKKAVLAAAGPVGKIVEIAEDVKDSNWGGAVKAGVKLAGSVVKNVDETGIKWAGLFGTKVKTEAPWKQAIGKYTDFSTGKKAFSTACSWAGEIVKAGYSNYKEFGADSFTNTRFYEETAAETLLKVGEGVLITAGAAAVFAGSPAIVGTAAAGGLTVAVDKGLDAIVTYATANTDQQYTEWTEFASDKICDFGEQAVESAGRVISEGNRIAAEHLEKAKEKVEGAIENISGGIRNAFGNFTSWGHLQAA